MAIVRRRLLGALGLSVLGATPAAALARSEQNAAALDTALAESPLLYLSPLRSNGALSRCQAEVWFQALPGAAVVVTRSDAWRARAIRQGLTATQLWIGDVGLWRRSNGSYRSLPSARATGTTVEDAAEQARLLDLFGAKYRREWGVWGPRFRRGLNEGSRVMLRYDLEPLTS